MNAPDKIYIPIYPNYNGDGTHLGDDWFTFFQNSAKDNIAYIRKDALLKILTDLRDDAGVRDDQYEKNAILEYNLYDELIKKINEM